MSLKIKLQQNRIYWQFRNLLLKLNFFANKFIFKSKFKLQNTKTVITLSSKLVSLSIRGFLWSIIIVFTLLVSESLLITHFPDKLAVLLQIRNYILANSSALNSLLIAVASVIGVFLGLYFTAISIVVSSMFATVPSDIRELLLKEKVGNVYIHILSICLATSILLLGMKIINLFPGALALIYVLFLACFSIFGFVFLGLRVFFFFDPSVLVDSIFTELSENVKLSTIKGLKWEENNFQAHYQKKASKSISTLKDLVGFCTKTPYLQKKPLTKVLLKIINFLGFYQKQKRLIPTKSYWFSRIPKYKDIFLVDASALTLALQSQTTIQPELVPDKYWIENELFEIIISALKSALDKGNMVVALELINTLNNYFEQLGKELNLKRCREIFNKVNKIVENYFLDLSADDCKNFKNDVMALLERQNLAPMSYSLGFYKAIRDSNFLDMETNIDSIRWKNERDIYGKDFCPKLLDRMEFLHERLSFEKEIEGSIISPVWYRRQLVFMQYENLLHEAVEIILKDFKDYFIKGVDKFIEEKKFIMAAWQAKKGIEAISKFKAHYPRIKETIKKMDKYNIEKELQWSKWEWDTIVQKVNDANVKLVSKLAQCIPDLSLIKTTEHYPDLFGETYHTVCQECIDSLSSNNVHYFQSIFPFIFVGSFQAHERLRASLQNHSTESLILLSFEPLLDILELSGYAYIYSELFSEPSFWNQCKNLWDNYLNKQGNNKVNFIKTIVSFHEYRASQLRLFSRDVWKTNWKQQLNRKLRDSGLIERTWSYSRMGERVEHDSPFIRALCAGNYEPHITASEIFLLTYLRNQCSDDEVSINDRYGFIKRLEKEKADTDNNE